MRPDSVELILGLLRKTMSNQFTTFYDGDPDLIPDFNLPACIVTKTSDTEVAGTLLQDDVTETLVIKAILNKKDDWADQVDPVNMTEKKLRRLVEARDATTGRFLPNTFKGALRPDIDGDRRIGKQMSLEIGVQVRPGDLLTAEAHLTIQLKYLVNVNKD